MKINLNKRKKHKPGAAVDGAGIGASHQTGWTGCIARIIQTMGLLNSEMLLSDNAEQKALKAAAGKK